jgi:hypothetical protein
MFDNFNKWADDAPSNDEKSSKRKSHIREVVRRRFNMVKDVADELNELIGGI